MRGKRKKIRKIGRIGNIFADWIRSSGFGTIGHVALDGVFSGVIVQKHLARGSTCRT